MHQAGRLAQAALLTLLIGCGREGASPPAPAPILPPPPPTPVPTYLDFAPADTEAVVQMNLAELVRRDPGLDRVLDFFLHSQQPTVWETLRSAELRLGREIERVHLVVGANARAGDAFLVAATGALAPAQLAPALRRSGGLAEPVGREGALFTWPSGTVDGARAAIPPLGPQVEAAVGLAPGLIVVGPPALVRRALLVHGGEAPGLAGTLLAAEIAAVDIDAAAWGAACGHAGDDILDELAPGLGRGHFHAAVATLGDGLVELQAEFATPEQAEAFRARLERLLAGVAALAAGTQLGPVLYRMKSDARLRVDGRMVTLLAAM